MIDFLLKFFWGPEDIVGIVLNLLNIAAFCVVFHEVGIKWWKSLIPIYSTYLLYGHFWKYKWLCLLEFAFLVVDSRCMATIRKSILTDVYEFSVAVIENQTLEVDVNLPVLILCILGCVISSLIVFVMKRMTYYKISKKLSFNVLKTILCIISPVFFLGFILYGKWKKKKSIVEGTAVLPRRNRCSLSLFHEFLLHILQCRI